MIKLRATKSSGIVEGLLLEHVLLSGERKTHDERWHPHSTTAIFGHGDDRWNKRLGKTRHVVTCWSEVVVSAVVYQQLMQVMVVDNNGRQYYILVVIVEVKLWEHNLIGFKVQGLRHGSHQSCQLFVDRTLKYEKIIKFSNDWEIKKNMANATEIYIERKFYCCFVSICCSMHSP